MKICKSCKTEKELNQFRTSKKTGKPLNPCFACRKAKKDAYNAANKELNNATKDAWAKRNPEKVRAAKRKWKNENIGKVKADKAKRKEYVERATPKWLTPFQLEVIHAKYEYAELKTKITGIKHNVDHIIPLRGENVSGLNVPWNLEVITAEENIKKRNKLLWWRLNG